MGLDVACWLMRSPWRPSLLPPPSLLCLEALALCLQGLEGVDICFLYQSFVLWAPTLCGVEIPGGGRPNLSRSIPGLKPPPPNQPSLSRRRRPTLTSARAGFWLPRPPDPSACLRPTQTATEPLWGGGLPPLQAALSQPPPFPGTSAPDRTRDINPHHAAPRPCPPISQSPPPPPTHTPSGTWEQEEREEAMVPSLMLVGGS